MTTQLIIEALDLTEGTINSEQRTVRQVLIRSGLSKNKRVYASDVLQKAAPLFEGIKTYANHPGKEDIRNRPERSVRDVTGWISDVKFEEGAIVGIRHFARTQAGNDSWAIVEDIVGGKAPASLMGASINAIGRGKAGKFEEQDAFIVEAIEAAHSVDDVTSPAAGGGFSLTASDSDSLMTSYIQALTFEEFFEARPDYIKRIQNEMKTVRQDDALKAAKAEAEATQTTLQETQSNLTALQTEHEATVTELATARRELAIEKALRSAMLPALYESDLRKRLTTVNEAEWLGIIETEKKKAQQVIKPRVTVTGAGQQVHTQPVTLTATIDPAKLIRQRLAQVQSPDELLSLLGR